MPSIFDLPPKPEEGKLSLFSRSILHGGNISDAGSTIYGINSGKVEEKNSFYGNNPSDIRVLLTKGLASVAEDLLLSKLAKHHPKLANNLAKITGGFNFGVAANNIYQTRKE